MKKIVLVVGAGATLSDATFSSLKHKPPLDYGFFAGASKTYPKDTRPIVSFFKKTYGIDLLKSDHDSLEQALALLYSDISGPEHSIDSQLRKLVNLFMRRVAITTNRIWPNQRSHLYRIVSYLLRKKVPPPNITFITFNQDIQIEKTLYEISGKATFADKACELFSFPDLYRLPDKGLSTPSDTSVPTFPTSENHAKCIELLKLHGSLNWYSLHHSENISRRAQFNANRNFLLATAATIMLRSVVKQKRKFFYTFPIVIPPLTHKSGIMHTDIRALWRLAEKKLHNADIVVIFGYSCPSTDFESANMFSKNLRKIRDRIDFYLIDPDPQILARYVQLSAMQKVYYYSDASEFLRNIDGDLVLT